jgi:protein involved in polysaccharide export with SLBB domain
MNQTLSPILLAFYLLGNIPVWAEPATPTFKLGVVRSGYSLGPGDVIKVGVLDFDEFSGQQMVLPDGTITLPVIGAVQAAGLSQEELAQELTDRLKPITKRPIVSVSLAFMRPLVVNITGEVRAPGPLQLNSLSSLPTLSGSTATAGTSLRIPLLSNAISNAGGVTRDADIRRISISRLNQQGGTSTFTVNLWDRITAQQAHAWGMIWRHLPGAELQAEAMALAQRLAQSPKGMGREVRHAFHEAQVNDLASQMDYERLRQRDLIDTPAFHEGLNAFQEKRAPNFHGD